MMKEQLRYIKFFLIHYVTIKNGGVFLAIQKSKFQARLISSIKKFQNILNIAKTKDINESDTVVIVTDMLSELFGFD